MHYFAEKIFLKNAEYCTVREVHSVSLLKILGFSLFSHSAQENKNWLPDDGIMLKVWYTTTLQLFDQQRLTVPLLKDLNLFCLHIVLPRN